MLPEKKTKKMMIVLRFFRKFYGFVQLIFYDFQAPTSQLLLPLDVEILKIFELSKILIKNCAIFPSNHLNFMKIPGKFLFAIIISH
jgi:hypothetical protein